MCIRDRPGSAPGFKLRIDKGKMQSYLPGAHSSVEELAKTHWKEARGRTDSEWRVDNDDAITTLPNDMVHAGPGGLLMRRATPDELKRYYQAYCRESGLLK